MIVLKPLTSTYPQLKLKYKKPKKVKINGVKTILYPHIVIRRIMSRYSIAHSIPNKSKHKIAVLPLSCNVISGIIMRKFRRYHLTLLPADHYIMFCNHIIIAKEPVKVLLKRLSTKPNWKVLMIINNNDHSVPMVIVHKDHRTYDIFTLPPMSMMLFLHVFDKNDPFTLSYVNYITMLKMKTKIIKELKVKARRLLRDFIL